jgi:ATP-dependent Clp protease ATP-binding subunit ClpA
MVILLRDGLNQDKLVVFISEIDLASPRLFRFLSQVSDDTTLTVT